MHFRDRHPNMRPEIAARRQAEFDAATSRTELEELQRRWYHEDREIERENSIQGRQLKDGLQRVATLERELAALKPKVGLTDDLAAALAEVIPQIVDDRIGRALQQQAFVRDVGVWTAERGYSPGELVSHKGAAWICQTKSTGARPGENSCWRLAVKSDLSELKRSVREEVERALAARPAVR
jgi:hypothetical protein